MSSLTRFTLAACATLGATAGIALAAAPVAVTQPASSVAATTATLNGTVSPNNTDTTYYFEYGASTAYGTATPMQGPIKGNADKAVSADVANLAASTGYHYRLVATNTDGTAYGADATFTTTAPGAPAPALTIGQSAKAVRFGRPVTISGTLTGPGNAGVQLALEENPAPYSGAFKATGLTTTTSASGNYSFAVSPAQNTHYRVTTTDKKPTVSPEVAVRVHVKVTRRVSDATPRRGQRVWFRGGVLPGHDGAIARIQRRTPAGKWRTVATARLLAAKPLGTVTRSRYAKRVRVRKTGTYRVRVAPGDGDHIAGNSYRRRLVVH